MAKLFIVGFPRDMEEIELVEMFSLHGTVNTVTIITDKVTGQSKGYGFITMTDDEGAARAIHVLDGASIDDRQISVRIAQDKNQDPPESTAKQFSNHSTSSSASARPVNKKRPRKAP